MDLLTVQSRVHDVLLSVNSGKPFVSSAQIQQFLDQVEVEFSILINDSHWQVARSFISRYPDLAVNKSIFIDFLSDLLQVDFLQYVLEKLDTKKEEHQIHQLQPRIEYQEQRPLELTASTLGSPMHLTEKLLVHDEDFMTIPKHISESIENLPTRTISPKEQRKSIIEISLVGCIRTILDKLSSFLPYLNTILLFLLIFLVIVQQVSVKDHICPLLRSAFLFETTQDLYWWQRWLWTERVVWAILEWTRCDEL